MPTLPPETRRRGRPEISRLGYLLNGPGSFLLLQVAVHSEPPYVTMLLALAKAAPRRADIRLAQAQAIKQFDDDVSVEERATLRSYSTGISKSPSGIHDVMQLTAEINRRAAGERRDG